LLFQNNWIVDTRTKIDEYNECVDDAVDWQSLIGDNHGFIEDMTQ
jgi:hypothetical protein